MKRSFNVNLGGVTFSFDEDALELMERYIARVTEYYKGNGEELKVTEVEEKIATKISARVAAGGIVTIELVKAVLDEIGLPFGAADFTSEDTGEKNGAPQNGGTADASSSAGDEAWRAAMLMGKKLFRDSCDKYIGGVLAGIAKYFGWSIAAVRAVAVLLFILGFAGGALSFLLSVAYIVMWITVPAARSVVDVTRMRKPQPLGYSTADIEAAWRNNYQMAIAELTYPKSKGCLAAAVKILFFIFILIVGLPLLFALGVVLFVLVVVFLALVKALGIALFANVYVLVLLLLPLFALVHWILKKAGVCRPLNVYVKCAIVLGWLFTVAFAGYELYQRIENKGGWDKVQQSVLNWSLFDDDFWEDFIEKNLEGAECEQYAAWVDDNKNIPFVVDLKQNSYSDKVTIKFYEYEYWCCNVVDADKYNYDVTKLDIDLAGDENGVVRFVWNPASEEILVCLDSSLGASMRLVSNGHNIRYINKGDTVTYSNAAEKGCVPFEIHYFDRERAAMYMFGNDTVNGVYVPPVKTRLRFTNNGSITINGHTIVGNRHHSADDLYEDEDSTGCE
ncbi:MAG: PspC domain-containing protein [Bacteroidaceae bacterium]|nr:PspC domain-containing protein [Bacteroidaceae bacterium]